MANLSDTLKQLFFMRLNWNPPKIYRETARHSNSAEYASDVHSGGVRPDGSRTPDRPWMTTAVEEFPIAEAMRENYQITGNINEAFENTMYDLKAAMEQAITDERWGWDRITIRSDGSVAGSPRDIIDTGKLLESQSLEFLP